MHYAGPIHRRNETHSAGISTSCKLIPSPQIEFIYPIMVPYYHAPPYLCMRSSPSGSSVPVLDFLSWLSSINHIQAVENVAQMVAKGLFAPATLGPTVETTAFSLASVSTIVVLLR